MAIKTFNAIRDYLELHDLNFSQDEEKLSFAISFGTKDIPLNHFITVEEHLPLYVLTSVFPFSFTPENTIIGALACNFINSKTIDGCFYIDTTNGSLYFKSTFTYASNKTISSEELDYMFELSNTIVDDYNDLLFDLSADKIDFKHFMTISGS